MYFGPSGQMKKAIVKWHSVDADLCLTFAGINNRGMSTGDIHTFVRNVAIDTALHFC